MKQLLVGIICLGFAVFAFGQEKGTAQKQAEELIRIYTKVFQPLYAVVSEAYWQAATDVTDEHTGQRIGADKVYSSFQGNPYWIEQSRAILKSKDQLDPITAKQVQTILYNAAHSPGTIPQVVNERVAAEAQQSAILDGFEFCMEKQGDNCAKAITPNQITDVLMASTNMAERENVWEVSKQSGIALRPGLVKLQDLRNKTAQATGYSSYFALEVSDYGMSVKEMMDLLARINQDLRPLYQQLHTWAKHRLAERYKQPVPQMIPAHWIGNRWAQSWPGIVEGVDLDPLFEKKSPEWIVQQAEKFYVSMGMPSLPKSFWEKSDLYELPADAKRKKNTHASAWHLDLENDVRSLMSVKPNFNWFSTTHHELGHIYYYLAYTNPNVPPLLRGGANRAFHEAVGDLIGIASQQIPYLREIGILPADKKIDQTQWLLNEALDNVVFIPWSAGVMSGWEHDFYEKKLPPEQFNQRWWEYKMKYQGIAPPEPRSEEFCDAATKTHINDDPAQYYDYALAFVIKYQLHDYISRQILKTDPHNANYYGNKEVGKFLWDLLKLGSTRDWREVIKEKTGEELSTRAMLAYFEPLNEYLKKENQGRSIGWEK